MSKVGGAEHSFPRLRSEIQKPEGTGLAIKDSMAQLISQSHLRIKNWKTFAKLTKHDHAKSKWTKADILAKQQLALLSSNNTASKPKEIKAAFCFLALVIS